MQISKEKPQSAGLRQAHTRTLPALLQLETQAQPAACCDGPAGSPGSSRLLNRVMMRETVMVNREDSLQRMVAARGGWGVGGGGAVSLGPHMCATCTSRTQAAAIQPCCGVEPSNAHRQPPNSSQPLSTLPPTDAHCHRAAGMQSASQCYFAKHTAKCAHLHAVASTGVPRSFSALRKGSSAHRFSTRIPTFMHWDKQGTCTGEILRGEHPLRCSCGGGDLAIPE